ncbi:hypothetical protein BN1723_015987, partial [Verticillium longisporum]
MTKFIKPRGKVDYTELGFEAGVKAMLDAQINYDDVEQGVACYCYGDSTCGQRVFYQFGMTQIPIYNVNNNCSTGSTGLAMARQFVSSGAADCVLVVGFEKMMPGSLQSFFNDRENPTGTTVKMMAETRGITKAPGAAQMFGNAGREYMEKHGAEARDFAEIARVNHEHSTRNPYSQFQDVYTLDQILDAPMIHAPLTKLQCCPTSDGAAAAVVVSQAFLDARPHLKSQAVLIAGQCMATDAPSLFSRSAIDLMGFEMTQHAVRNGITPSGDPSPSTTPTTFTLPRARSPPTTQKDVIKIPRILPHERVFPIQIGSQLFKLSGASISSDAPSYFSQYFYGQIKRAQETGEDLSTAIRTLYIDRDPETFHDISLHLQGYHVQPRDGTHFVRLFADAQFYSLPKLISQLFDESIFISIGHREFQIPRELFNDPGNSPNFFTLGFAVFFSNPKDLFPGLEREHLIRPPSILPPSVPNRSADIFADLVHFLSGYPVHI